MNMKNFLDKNEWVLDVTLPYLVFCPYDKETESVITGMNYISDKCPGKLLGIVHMNGEEAVEKWIKDNPELVKKYFKSE
jgi:hypothetical protein